MKFGEVVTKLQGLARNGLGYCRKSADYAVYFPIIQANDGNEDLRTGREHQRRERGSSDDWDHKSVREGQQREVVKEVNGFSCARLPLDEYRVSYEEKVLTKASIRD